MIKVNEKINRDAEEICAYACYYIEVCIKYMARKFRFDALNHNVPVCPDRFGDTSCASRPAKWSHGGRVCVLISLDFGVEGPKALNVSVSDGMMTPTVICC
jgi:hypothetical protein